ncbi:adipokinetic hormone/corazonin-related peptide receptor variant I-like [Babylonia areolata]|uniref:adipokinetic hormone/corazonin-related peptide receptor variant I-like n=1 Tax=Babylonia areolata TaxID=304850 RepID=UPI003FD152F3
MTFMKPEVVEELLGHGLDFYNGTHVLCARNTSLPPTFTNDTNIRCLYELPPLPKELYFSDDSLVSVIAYSCLFLVAACGNLTVFITLFRNRAIKSRVNLFIMHLSIADLLVTFMMLPLEIVWHTTVAWLAGDAMCRLMMFFRAFGFYLSSCILVAISLDRYFAIMHPLSINDATRRGKVMLGVSWAFSVLSSIPQSVIFHVERHPTHRWFRQCVTFNFFPSPQHELAYNLFNLLALYGLPLLIITASYGLILCQISKKTRQSKNEMCCLDDGGRPGGCGLRRSAMGNIGRARIRTLKMTLVIVGAFILCWTPYFVMSAWYWFDRESASKIDPKIQRGLFLFAVSNSCINPIVYGTFTIQFKREFILCCYCLQHQWRKRRGAGSHVGKHRTALLYTHRSNPRSSESSGSVRGERPTRSLSTRNSESPGGLLYQSSAPSPFSSRLPQLPAAGGYTLGVFLSGSASGGGSDVSTECSRMSLNSIGREQLLPDRANINNFVRVSSEY